MRQKVALVLLVVAFAGQLVVAFSREGGVGHDVLAAAWGALVVRQVVVVWREARDRRATSEGVAGEG